MFEPTSRYFDLPLAELSVLARDGETRRVRYVTRRLIPSMADAGRVPLVGHVVIEGDRLDVVTARYLADPTQFWRVCDANGAIRPDELTEVPGRVITIALPQGVGI